MRKPGGGDSAFLVSSFFPNPRHKLLTVCNVATWANVMKSGGKESSNFFVFFSFFQI